MTDATLNATNARYTGWLCRVDRWMDERGKGAWIAAMVLVSQPH